MKIEMNFNLPSGISESILERTSISVAISNVNTSLKYYRYCKKNSKDNPELLELTIFYIA